MKQPPSQGPSHHDHLPATGPAVEDHGRVVTANTRADGEEFLALAAKIPVRTHTTAFDLGQANQALQMLKHDELKGAAVLRIS